MICAGNIEQYKYCLTFFSLFKHFSGGDSKISYSFCTKKKLIYIKKYLTIGRVSFRRAKKAHMFFSLFVFKIICAILTHRKILKVIFFFWSNKKKETIAMIQIFL